MTIQKTIQAIGKDIGTINKAINAIDGKIKQVSDELSNEYITISAYNNLTSQLDALFERVEKLEQITQSQSTQPQAEPQATPSEPSAPSNEKPTLYRNRSYDDADNAKVISDITAWYDTLPADDGQVSLERDSMNYNKAGKLYVYFDGFRLVKNLETAGVLHNYSDDKLAHDNDDGEQRYDVTKYYNYDVFSNHLVHATVVRQDGDDIYGVYNGIIDKANTWVFKTYDFS